VLIDGSEGMVFFRSDPVARDAVVEMIREIDFGSKKDWKRI